jgi:ATP-binding cassette subfamily B protein
MAKRGVVLEEGDKRSLNKSNLNKLLGIFRFTLPYRWTFILGIVSLALSSGTLLSFPYLAGMMLDVAQGKSVYFFTSITQVAVTLFAVLILQAIFSFVRVYTFSIVSERALADIRSSVYEKIIWLPQTFFDSRRVGELLSRITADVGTLQDVFSVTLAELLRQLLILLIGVPLLLFLMPKLTGFMLLTFPLLVIAALFFGKFIRKLSKKTQDQLASTNVIVEETLQSIVVVKSFTNEMFEVLRYKKSLRDVVNTAIRTARYRGLFISFVILALFGGIVGVSWYGAHLVEIKEATVGDLLSFVFYTIFIGGSIAGLGDIYSQVQKSIGASERIVEILDEKDEQSSSLETVKLHGEIHFNHVKFSYPTRSDVTVLHDLNFSIRPGEKIALVGPSGSGKSTIINLLMRFYPVNYGTIIADGSDISSYPLSAYRKNIGIVPQEVMLFGGTIKENISYGKPGASDEDVRHAAQKANALEFIEKFPEQFNTLVGDRGVKLSGGQRQRIAIARAILKDPSVLILDEATSSLDAGSEKLVQDALETLMENRTTIIIAHRLSTIRKVDRILVIKEGEIAESGSHNELSNLENGIYSNLLKLQIEIK